jgi:hypothetical protein
VYECAYPRSTVVGGQEVGITEVHDDIWLVGFMDYDLEYFDLETRVLGQPDWLLLFH